MLRPWREEDAPALAIAGNNPAVEQNLRDGFPSPYMPEDARAFIGACAKPDGLLYARAVTVDGQVAGSIALTFGENVYRKNAGLAYFLAEPYRPNKASCRVLEKAGFTLEGILRDSVTKHGKVMDSCMYALLRREWEAM